MKPDELLFRLDQAASSLGMRAEWQAAALQERAGALLARAAQGGAGAADRLREAGALLSHLLARLTDALGEAGGWREVAAHGRALARDHCQRLALRLLALSPLLARLLESRAAAIQLSLLVGLLAGRLLVRRAPRLQEVHMQSVVCGSYCGPGGLALCRIPTPRIASEDEVLVRVMAGGLDRSDLLAVSGWGRLERGRRHGGFSIGRDFCGVVVEAGLAVHHLAPGDRVWGAVPAHLPGVLAEQVVVPGSLAHRMPTNLNWEGAATVPYSALQVWGALVWRGGLLPDQGAGTSLLVVDGVTDTGCLAVQLAALWGATVTALCSARTSPLARALGAHTVVPTGEDCLAGLALHGPYDLILVAGDVLPQAALAPLLAPRGHLTSALPPPLPSDQWGSLRRLLHPLWRGVVPAACAPAGNLAEPLAYVTEAVQAGRLQPVLDSVVGPREVATTLAELASAGSVGKSVVLWDKL
jgi:NADPH:quinone reductase-like Zn-dependent oxidoreductase